MPIPNEDRLRERYDAMLTHDDPHSPSTMARWGGHLRDCGKPRPTLANAHATKTPRAGLITTI